MNKVLILGVTGMLGNACEKLFLHSSKDHVITTSRNKLGDSVSFDAKTDRIEALIEKVEPDWIINCIGVIKPHINENLHSSIENAIEINSLFPHRIAKAIEGSNTKVIQIATDCVFSGEIGSYTESQPHDALDVYGKTKSLGEVNSGAFIHLRASIIGPERGRSSSLLEWFLGQKPNAEVKGFTDHLWNGITTHHFAKLALSIIETKSFSPGVKHVIPADVVTKAELLGYFRGVYGRSDIVVHAAESAKKIDRTLSTNQIAFSDNLWIASGYKTAPTVEQMVQEQFDFNRLHI